MVTINELITKLKTVTSKWHYLKEETDAKIENLDMIYTPLYMPNNANMNVVTNNGGRIVTEAKPTIPSKTSDLTNDSGFITSHQDISGKADISDFDTVTATINYTDNTSETVTFYVVPSNNNG